MKQAKKHWKALNKSCRRKQSQANGKFLILVRHLTVLWLSLSAFQKTYNLALLSRRGFKATKQIVKLQFQMGLYDDMMNSYNKLLHYIHTNVVTRNMGEKVINSLLEFVSNCSDMNVLQRFYETTLEALREAKNEVKLLKHPLHSQSTHSSSSTSISAYGSRPI